MNLFGPRQVTDDTARAEVAELRAELQRHASVIRQLETEQQAMHDQVRRWMRRAVAAERSVETNQELPLAPAVAAGVTPSPPLNGWGARARIAARRARFNNGAPPPPESE